MEINDALATPLKNDMPMHWPQAKSSCKFNNKRLVVMATEGEWEFLKNEIQTRDIVSKKMNGTSVCTET